MSDLKRLTKLARESIPCATPDIIEWANQNVVLPDSARSSTFNISITPWLREPLLAAADKTTRVVTFTKPVQSGGSVLGEIMLLFWICYSRKLLQYNWSTNKRAIERWDSRIEKVMKACRPVGKMMEKVGEYQKGEIDFGNVFLRCQGAFIADNLDSDSVRLQINEEVHSWEAGHLKKARNRLTAVWDHKSIDISNAGAKGDQLDQEFRNGTMQYWMGMCPGCGQLHRMQTKWDEKRPELGGLRYDAAVARTGNYEYNYTKLRPTIRYQMPCGFEIHNEDISLRRAVSSGGQYSEPTNLGAESIHKSFSYDAVIVDYIDWMTLIKDKHDALRARAYGDPEPFRRYICERECVPYDYNDTPIIGLVSTVKGLKKNRNGIENRLGRFAAIDRQEGELQKGQFPHWWAVIRDVALNEEGSIKSLLVWEGKLETDEQVVSVLTEHEVDPSCVIIDSGHDTMHVYKFCLQHGFNAIKGGREMFYAHEGGARKIYSPARPLHSMVNARPSFNYIHTKDGPCPDPREPMFWLYSKAGIRERWNFLRTNTGWDTPDDVSDDYQIHMESEERERRVSPLDGSVNYVWIQRKDRNDLFVCECYIAMMIEMSGLIDNLIKSEGTK